MVGFLGDLGLDTGEDRLGPDEWGIVPGTETWGVGSGAEVLALGMNSTSWARCRGPALASTWGHSADGGLTLSTDASQVRDLHQHLREHVGAAGPPFPHIDL